MRYLGGQRTFHPAVFLYGVRYMLIITWTALIIFLPPTLSHAQGHYPLSMGNNWQYILAGESSSIWTRTIVADSTMPNGKTYSTVLTGWYHNTPNPPIFLREDPNRVYQYGNGYEYVIYDFSKNVGDTVSINPGGYAIWIARIQKDTVFGMVKRVYLFRGQWSSEWIADSLGLIKGIYEPAIEYDIYGARVNGVMYGTFTSIGNTISESPTTYRLLQNYPNPFNPSTTIHFEIPKFSHVTLSIYNVLGQLVQTVVNGERAPGVYDVRVDGSRWGSGVYYYRVVAGNFIQTNKMIVLR